MAIASPTDRTSGRARGRLFVTARRRLLTDRLAALAIRAGGLAVIASILLILAFLLVEVWPVLRPARVVPTGTVALAGSAPQALLVDEYRTHLATLAADGSLRVVRTRDGARMAEASIGDGVEAIASDPLGSAFAAVLADGTLVAVPVAFDVRFEGSERRISPRLAEPVRIALAAEGARPAPGGPLAVRVGDESFAAAVALADGDLLVVRRSVSRNVFTGETKEQLDRQRVAMPAAAGALALDPEGRMLFAGTRDGRLLRFRLGSGAPERLDEVRASTAGISALALLIGGRSLVVGRQDGALEIWFAVPEEAGPEHIERIRRFDAYPGAVHHVAPSQRDRTFLVEAGDGVLGLHHSTSGRTLWRSDAPLADPTAIALAPRGNGAVIAGADRAVTLSVRNPHPELSLGTLFGKVWYEGFPAPAWVWQSSSGDDTFEPKLSLVPLVFGTLKGTFYALLLAIPLGVLGAMYTSQFMHPRLQRWVKPGVEVMAALPSVVLGFLAGLWLAPRLERVFPAMLLMGVALPLAAIGAGWLWSRLPRRWLRGFPEGTEIAWIALAIVAAGAACLALAAPFEQAAFGGTFSAWLERSTGMAYDQRNAVVVGIGMGFAVIPIIFAIAEDAFSNVPTDLSHGSLALGANRWQTVVRVVLPTASPGIFSAIMIGFGRAVGETMIVLMATGNTPIMDWSPFNGFRTLSANIAVEIPEAPQGGTLYRTLFIAALLLFALTFLVNTAAELVRHRLRHRYGRL